MKGGAGEERQDGQEGPCSLPTKVKRSTGGRTQQIRLRLSPTFPKILAREESKTHRDRGREPLTTYTQSAQRWAAVNNKGAPEGARAGGGGR